MKRIVWVFSATLVALVLLFSYRTSLGNAVVALSSKPAHVVRIDPQTSAQAGAPSTSGPGPQPSTGGTTSADGTTSAGTTTGSTTKAGGASSTGGTTSPGGTTSASNTGTTVVDGAVQYTPYGPVQVRITLSNGTITAVTVLQQPSAQSRSQEISAFALPQLRQETLAAGNARIDAVSGATYTTEGYIASLQSALDAAHAAA